MNILAILAVYNEGDVIEDCLKHLVDDGIDVYLIDNCSTDRTLELARPYCIGTESVETAGYEWGRLLQRKLDISKIYCQYDWYIHVDADEFRYSPWEEIGYSYRLGIERVDSLGYNAIDHLLYEWVVLGAECMNGFSRSDFTHAKYIGSHSQLKTWKNLGVETKFYCGGHYISFDGLKVFETPFLLEHYPLRGVEHGVRKIFEERKPRYTKEELDKHWHIHYDGLVNADSSSIVADVMSADVIKYDRNESTRNCLNTYLGWKLKDCRHVRRNDRTCSNYSH